MDEKTKNVLVCGGGPAGLAFAIKLVDFHKRGGEKVAVTVVDTRWETYEGKVVHTLNSRRGQVVTLQNDALKTLGHLGASLVIGCPSVWGPSKNIAISDVEDRLIDYAQSEGYADCIKLVPMEAGPDQVAATYYQPEELKKYDIVVCADGSNSQFLASVMPSKKPQVVNYHPDEALGVEFEGGHIPASHAVLLTMTNRRYLLNSDPRKKGFLNVALAAPEGDIVQELKLGGASFSAWKAARGKHVVFGQLLDSIEEGLQIFGIDESAVKKINFIKLALSHSPDFVYDLVYPNKQKEKDKVWVIGDAAFSTHFWPGRGMNSALKEAVQLAWFIARGGKPNEFRGWMTRLRCREHTDRSQHFLCREGMKTTFRDVDVDQRSRDDVIKSLAAKVNEAAIFLRTRPGWSIDNIPNVATVFANTSLRELLIMDLSGVWPSTPGDEVEPSEEITSDRRVQTLLQRVRDLNLGSIIGSISMAKVRDMVLLFFVRPDAFPIGVRSLIGAGISSGGDCLGVLARNLPLKSAMQSFTFSDALTGGVSLLVLFTWDIVQYFKKPNRTRGDLTKLAFRLIEHVLAVAAGVGGGVLGGMLGAFLGGLTGPGALICIPLFGVILTFVGSFAADWSMRCLYRFLVEKVEKLIDDYQLEAQAEKARSAAAEALGIVLKKQSYGFAHAQFLAKFMDQQSSQQGLQRVMGQWNLVRTYYAERGLCPPEEERVEVLLRKTRASETDPWVQDGQWQFASEKVERPVGPLEEWESVVLFF